MGLKQAGKLVLFCSLLTIFWPMARLFATITGLLAMACLTDFLAEAACNRDTSAVCRTELSSGAALLTGTARCRAYGIWHSCVAQHLADCVPLPTIELVEARQTYYTNCQSSSSSSGSSGVVKPEQSRQKQ